MMHRNRCIGWFALAATLAIASSPGIASAADSTWTNSSGGVYSTSGNWSAGVPGALNTATFDLPGTYTVTFSNSPTNNGLFVQNGTVTFNLAGQTYTQNGT